MSVDKFQKQAIQLAKTFGLNPRSTSVNDIARILRSGTTNKSLRDGALQAVQKDQPRLYDAVKAISDQMAETEQLIRTLFNPEDVNPTVEFYPRLVNDPLYQLDEFDDFINAGISGVTGSIGKLGWIADGAGSLFSTGITTAEPAHPGIINLATNAGVGNIYAMSLGQAATLLTIVVEDILREQWVTRIVGTFDDSEFRWGFMDDELLAPPAEGIYFEIIDPTSANIRCITRTGGVQTVTDSGVVAAVGTWYKFEIYRLDDGTFDFFINDVLVANHTTNIPPDGTGLVISTNAQTNVADSREWEVDYFRITSVVYPYDSRRT